MPTFVLPATRATVTLNDAGDVVGTDLTESSFGLLAQSGVSTITYAYAGPSGTQAVLSSVTDFAGIVIDDQVLWGDDLNLFVEDFGWTQDGVNYDSLILLLGAASEPLSLFLVHLGGDPLPEFETPEEFTEFAQNGLSRRLPDTHPVGPEQPLSLTDLPGVSVIDGDYVRGTPGVDPELFGTDGSDYISGFESDDAIDGFYGNDTIYAGSGDDLIVFNIGDHVVEGGSGFDTSRLEAYTFPALQVTFTGAPDGDAFIIEGFSSVAQDNPALFTITATGVERYQNEFREEALTVIGDAGANSLYLEFLPSVFDFQAGGGVDELALGTIDTYEGQQYQSGFTFVDFIADAQLSGNETDLQITLSGGQVGTVSSVEDFVFADGTFSAIALLNSHGGTASSLSDRLAGGAGHDTIFALEGNDRVEGRLGNDSLFGNRGDDTLLGQGAAPCRCALTAQTRVSRSGSLPPHQSAISGHRRCCRPSPDGERS